MSKNECGQNSQNAIFSVAEEATNTFLSKPSEICADYVSHTLPLYMLNMYRKVGGTVIRFMAVITQSHPHIQSLANTKLKLCFWSLPM